MPVTGRVSTDIGLDFGQSIKIEEVTPDACFKLLSLQDKRRNSNDALSTIFEENSTMILSSKCSLYKERNTEIPKPLLLTPILENS